MEGKIILNLAMSLDGYIADNEGGFDWIHGDGNSTLDTENKWSYEEFLKDIDIVVMGSNCYKQEFHKDFKEQEVYIATSKSIENYENYHFVNENIVDTILELKNKGKKVFLFGGGILIDSFVKRNVIDEYIIGIIPTILGNGRKLFLENNPKIDLTLKNYFVEEGTVIMVYSKID
ncbi:dihydrofolate reductase family protein [Peptacetobacter hiranonis]|uniref:dihydrofolate reductase family protein n=1 Tax=Peptacetobacter hiranonis TaxID=89152 RepID=UPI0022E545A0|nr:dihydrofolate reductase family protein [Peptacetobacter hiranonis]